MITGDTESGSQMITGDTDGAEQTNGKSCEGYGRLRMDIGGAIRAVKEGYRVAREGWNGKGMWISYSPGANRLPADSFWSGPNRGYALLKGGYADVLPFITMKTATGEILNGWLASQSDLLADDWMIVH